MTEIKFRHPSEMLKEEDREPVSARVKSSTKKTLEGAAKAEGLSLALLVANVLDDYANWLKQAKKAKS